VLQEKCESFQSKLVLFIDDLGNGELLHFPTTKMYLTGEQLRVFVPQLITFITKLQANFNERFEDFRQLNDVFIFVRDPFIVTANGAWTVQAEKSFPLTSRAKLQLETVDLQSSAVLRNKLTEVGVIDFWSKFVTETTYPTVRKLALSVLTMFGSTYTCESSFSIMNIIKNKQRNSLTDEHLQNSLRIALTTYMPNYKDIMKGRQYHLSH